MIDMQAVHEWLDAGNDPQELIDWVEQWMLENPGWMEMDAPQSDPDDDGIPF